MFLEKVALVGIKPEKLRALDNTNISTQKAEDKKVARFNAIFISFDIYFTGNQLEEKRSDRFYGKYSFNF